MVTIFKYLFDFRLIFYALRRREPQNRIGLEKTVSGHHLNPQNAQTGIIGVFPSFLACKKRIWLVVRNNSRTCAWPFRGKMHPHKVGNKYMHKVWLADIPHKAPHNAHKAPHKVKKPSTAQATAQGRQNFKCTRSARFQRTRPHKA